MPDADTAAREWDEEDRHARRALHAQVVAALERLAELERDLEAIAVELDDGPNAQTG